MFIYLYIIPIISSVNTKYRLWRVAISIGIIEKIKHVMTSYDVCHMINKFIYEVQL